MLHIISTCTQERHSTDDFNFPLASCKSTFGKKTITKQANNACRTAGELLGHFPKKIRFVFRSKTFPKNDALTQKRSNVQDDSDVVKDSFSSTPSGQFRSIFVELSAVFLVLTFLLLFTTQPKEKFSHQFLLQCLLNI